MGSRWRRLCDRDSQAGTIYANGGSPQSCSPRLSPRQSQSTLLRVSLPNGQPGDGPQENAQTRMAGATVANSESSRAIFVMIDRKRSSKRLIFLPIWVSFIPNPVQSDVMRRHDWWVNVKHPRLLDRVGPSQSQGLFERQSFSHCSGTSRANLSCLPLNIVQCQRDRLTDSAIASFTRSSILVWANSVYMGMSQRHYATA